MLPLLATECGFHFDEHQKNYIHCLIFTFVSTKIYLFIRHTPSTEHYVPETHEEKYYIRAKIEAVNHLHAVFLLSTEQRQRPIRLPRALVYFDVTDVA